MIINKKVTVHGITKNKVVLYCTADNNPLNPIGVRLRTGFTNTFGLSTRPNGIAERARSNQ